MQVQPYLQFDGRCEEALNFYKNKLGAEIEAMMRFKEAPERMDPKPENDDKIMHSSFRIGDSRIMASDGYCHGKPSLFRNNGPSGYLSASRFMIAVARSFR